MPYRINRYQVTALTWFKKQFSDNIQVNIHHLPYVTYRFYIIDKPAQLTVHINSIMASYIAFKDSEK